MANAFTDILSGASLGTNLVQTAYDRLLEFNLRSTPMFRSIADKKPAQQAMPGSTVTFQLYNDLSAATGTLAETTDPDAVAVPATSTVSVTLNEYGNVVLTTRKLELFSLSDIDPAVANMVAFNCADSIDNIVQTVLRGGTNVIRESAGALSTTAAVTTVTATDTAKARDFRYAVTKLRANNVVPKNNGLYTVHLHPEVSHDLRVDSAAANWRTPHEYSSPDAIWAGELGTFEGARYIESPRCYNAQDGSGTGATQTRVYRSYVTGAQALAEAVAEEPHVVQGPVVDKLGRFRPLGWYAVMGHTLYRQAAVWRVETASSVRPNA